MRLRAVAAYDADDMSLPTLLIALDARLRRLPRPALLGLGLVGVALLAVLDAAGQHRLPLESFYVAPVLAVGWLSDSTPYGLAVAIAAALVRPAEALLASSPVTLSLAHLTLLASGAVIQAVLYLLILYLLASGRESLHRREAQALRDALTGIANRRAFMATARAELERSRRYGHELSLLYLDVDDFKAVNDRLGHGEGNRLLCRLAQVLSASRRAADTPARLGGDEFAVLMPETESKAAAQLAKRLMGALEQETTYGGAPLTCSLGLVTFRVPPTSVEVLFASADRLMYAAKAAGKNRLRRATLPAGLTANSKNDHAA